MTDGRQNHDGFVRSRDGLAFACPVCGAGHLVKPRAIRLACRVCGAPAEFRRCPMCTAPFRAGPPFTLPAVKNWQCPSCGNTTARRRWQVATVSECPPLPYETSMYGNRLREVLSSPSRRRFNGQILSLSGVSGVASGMGYVLFDKQYVAVLTGDVYRPLWLRYSDIAFLQVGGRGDFATTSGGGWVGGGFGTTLGGTAKGMLQGAALAGVMNALTTRTEHHTETIILLAWSTGSLSLLNDQLSPASWYAILAPVFSKIDAAHVEAAKARAEKACPFCAETILAAAIRCRFCGADLAEKGSSG